MGGLGAIAGVLFSVIIGLAVGLIGVVLGLFVGHIIVFDSIALGVIGGLLAYNFLPIHPAFSLIIGIVVCVVLLLIQNTRFGFWIVGTLMSVLWGFIFGFIALAISKEDFVWMYVVWGLGTIIMMVLHTLTLIGTVVYALGMVAIL